MFKQIIKYAKPFKKTLAIIAGLILIMAILKQTEPFITKRITDLVVEKNGTDFKLIVQLLGLLLLVKLIQTGLNRFSWYLTNIFVVKFETHLKNIGFDHLMKLSLTFYNNQATGKVMSKLDRGVNRIVNIVNNSGMHFLPSVTAALISFVIVLQYEWRIAVLVLIGFIPYILVNRWRFEKNNKLEKKEYKLYDEQYSHFWEVLNSMSLIKAFRAESFERKQLKKFFKKYLSLRREMEDNTNRAVLGDLFLELTIWAIYAYMVWITWQGGITIGTLIMIVGLIRLMREPLWQLNWIFWEIKRAQIGAKDFFRIMKVDLSIPEPKNPVKLKTVKGKIEFEQVHFTYQSPDLTVLGKKKKQTTNSKKPQALKVLEGVSFTIPPKKMTAFVGPSGAGKTTVASLVMRFFDPEKGKITLDNIDLKKIKKENLRAYMGLVSQDSHLFATTIANNLRYAKPNASLAEMKQACKVAYADKFIDKLPAGLQTEIGERGVKLSGGQKQRLSLARTILSNPEIIILDEATSALDSESEMYIQRALNKLLKDKTSIVIAHRLSTIQQADQIIVLKNKQVLETGNHQELIAQDGLYASLFKIQSGDKKLLDEWELVE